jgi:hypothetical protein
MEPFPGTQLARRAAGQHDLFTHVDLIDAGIPARAATPPAFFGG